MHQAIARTNAALLSIGPLGTNFSENFIRNASIVVQENALQNAVCEIVAILPKGGDE